MKLRTYHAFTMAEALAAVKRDLGADAVILHTRTFKRGGIFGVMARTIVEVTASPAQPQRTAKPPAKERAVTPKAASARQAYAAAAGGSVGSAATNADEDRERTRRLAIAMHEAHSRRAQEHPRQTVEPVAADEIKPTVSVQQRIVAAELSAAPASSSPPARAARRFVLNDPHSKTEQRIAVSIQHSALADEIGAIKHMVSHVLKRQGGIGNSAGPVMPKALFDMYLKLIAQDISDELADQIIASVRDELSHDELENEALVRTAILRSLSGFIPVADDAFPTRTDDGRPLTMALVGPTGVGKTTTLAKLAATFTLQHNKRVGLITADTFRIAAVDQLRTYADIMNLPLQVALTPGEMKHAVQQFSDRDVILIDTPGRSQRDTERLTELRRFIASAKPHEVQLVLSGTAGEKVLLQEAEAFAPTGVQKIVLTKLDEAVSFGMLVNTVRKLDKKLSFITTGQEVPEDIEVADANRIARMVLGDSAAATVEALTPVS